MRHPLLSFLLVLSTIPAQASSQEPSRSDIVHAAQTCTAEGAFGIRFGAAELMKGQAIGPFAVEQVSSRVNGVFRITALASFAKAQMSQEDRIALAGWVLRQLDAEIAAKRSFAAREPRPDGVTYYAAKERQSGYALDVSHAGVEVWMVCTNLSMDPHARPGRADD